MLRHLICCLSLLALPAFAAQDDPDRCHFLEPCPVEDNRSYHVLEPDGWDGTSPLPVLLHFHGWKRQGDIVVKHDRIASATRKRGVLLVAPNGNNRSWDFWHAGTPDVGFARNVLEDIKKRYPVDESQIYVSGYSWGSNMAWRFVCENGNDVTALMAIAGTLDQDEVCSDAPKQVRQVYGLKDTVLDFPYGPNGETDYPVALWRERLGCGAGEGRGEWTITKEDTFTRTVWEDCEEGRVSLDIHGRGHFIPRGWIARQLDELLDLPKSYP